MTSPRAQRRWGHNPLHLLAQTHQGGPNLLDRLTAADPEIVKTAEGLAPASMLEDLTPEGVSSHLERCLEALPKEPRALLSAGLLSLHEGLLDDARGYATQHLETVPENYPRRHRAYMLKAWCDDLTKKRVTARENRKNAQTAAQASGDPTAETEVRRFGRKRFTERDRKKNGYRSLQRKKLPYLISMISLTK